ncbi:unnamed protein product [Closterium sp. Naga37s-1]|nr:unnamed protein product [Closterium sp. Naga37s-1]
MVHVSAITGLLVGPTATNEGTLQEGEGTAGSVRAANLPGDCAAPREREGSAGRDQPTDISEEESDEEGGDGVDEHGDDDAEDEDDDDDDEKARDVTAMETSQPEKVTAAVDPALPQAAPTVKVPDTLVVASGSNANSTGAGKDKSTLHSAAPTTAKQSGRGAEKRTPGAARVRKPATPAAADVNPPAAAEGQLATAMPVITISDDPLERVMQCFAQGSEVDGGRKGVSIRDPPRGGLGKVGEPWLGGKKRWLGHHSLQEVQYLISVALMPYDHRVDKGVGMSDKQSAEWAEDLSIANLLPTGLFTTMHLHNLCGSVQRLKHMFREYLTSDNENTNVVAWSAVVGMEAADEEPSVPAGEPETLYAGAVACAVAMVWQMSKGSTVDDATTVGYRTALCAGATDS